MGKKMDENTNMKTANIRLPESFGDRISFLRKLKGLTQAQLAEKLGISAQAVSKWESGLSCPDIMMLVPLADIFDVSTDTLLGGGQLVGGEVTSEGNTGGEPEWQMNPDTDGKAAGESAAQDHAESDDSVQAQSKSGQGSKTESSGTGTSEAREKAEPEAGQTEESGSRQNNSNGRKWEEDWENGTLEIRKVFRENNVMIHSLHIDIGMVDAIIREGDEFALDLSCYPNGECREEVRDGVWKIKDRGYKDLFLLSNITNLFSERKIIIIIPKGYHFKDVKIKLGAGKLVGRGILTDASTLDLGAGEIVLADYYSGAAKIKCGMGKVMLEGQMRGRCKLDCGMGEIAASLVAPSEYGYRVKVGMGEVRVGENQLGGMGGTYKVNTNAENFFDINCGMGAVKVLFGE